MNLLFNVAHASDRLDQFIGNVNNLIINPLIVLLFALALALFLYGVVEFLANSDKEDARTKGKSHMLWGIVGFVIMIGVWSIINILMNTFNIPKSQIDPEKGTVNLPLD